MGAPLLHFEKPSPSGERLNTKFNYPERSHAPWNSKEDQYLREQVENGCKEKDLATVLKRSVGAITARLQHLTGINFNSKLLHFTDIRNLESIRKTGGLWSYSELKRRNITPVSTGGNDISRQLDDKKGLSEYVHLCLFPFHPMECRCREEGRFKESCFIEVSGQVLEHSGVAYTQGIANKTNMEKFAWGSYRDKGDDPVIMVWRHFNSVGYADRDEILHLSAQIKKGSTVDEKQVNPDLFLIARWVVRGERHQFLIPRGIPMKYLRF